MTSDSSVHDTVRTLVEGICLEQRGKHIPGDTWRLDAGAIDSLGIFQLVGLLEDAFGISIPDSEVIPQNFASVARITEFVDERRRA